MLKSTANVILEIKPNLILDDILVIQGGDGEFQVKVDHKLSRFLDLKLDRPRRGRKTWQVSIVLRAARDIRSNWSNLPGSLENPVPSWFSTDPCSRPCVRN